LGFEGDRDKICIYNEAPSLFSLVLNTSVSIILFL